MSYEESTFIGKLDKLSLCVHVCECCGGGGGGVVWLYSGGSNIDGDSILIAQQPKALDRVGRNG